MLDGFTALTDKEKQTLRLIVRGHDAKSIARHFDLSVHTINYRLRDARRKLVVSSSREAARLLLEREGACPDSFGHALIGEAAGQEAVAHQASSYVDREPASRRVPIFAGAALMTIALAVLALATAPQLTPAPTNTRAARAPSTAPEDATAAEVETSARQWLALLDQGRWTESWRATGSAFRDLNSDQVWASVSEKVRAPLGAALSRSLIGQEDIPAPPAGYRLIKFRTSFANKADAVETLSLVRENDRWRVVGIWIS